MHLTKSESARSWWFAHCRLAPDDGATAAGGRAALASKPEAQRAAERASERPVSAENEGMIPEMGDILKQFKPEVRKALGTAPEKPKDEGARVKDEGAEEEPEAEETDLVDEEETGEETAKGAEIAKEEEAVEAEPEEDLGLTDAAGAKVELPEEVKAVVGKRIGKLTAEKLEARERAEKAEGEAKTLREQLAAAQAGPIRIAPTPENPLAHVTNAEELAAAVRQAQAIEDWALRHPDGAEVVKDSKTGETEQLDKAAVSNHLANARRILNAAPARQNYLGLQEQSRQMGIEAYPAYFKAGTEESQALAQAKAALPWLAALRPDADLILADAMAGRKARLDAAAAKKKGAQALVKPPPAKVHGGAQPRVAPRVPARVVEKREQEAGLTKRRGDRRSVEAFAESIV